MNQKRKKSINYNQYGKDVYNGKDRGCIKFIIYTVY